MDIIISCEHASANIPAKYRPLFEDRQRVLNSHEGWDVGALQLATRLSKDLQAKLYQGRVSRLLVDLNRSMHHPALFSQYSKRLDRFEREHIIERYYEPYRSAIEKDIRQRIANRKRVVHLSVHSFTPIFNGQRRHCDIGLLYDPSRDHEPPLVMSMIDELKTHFPGHKLRRNYPYKGTADGLTTSLRAQFTENTYIGIELEINQKLVLNDDRVWRDLLKRLSFNLMQVLYQQEKK